MQKQKYQVVKKTIVFLRENKTDKKRIFQKGVLMSLNAQ